jgi:hypothetical protein
MGVDESLPGAARASRKPAARGQRGRAAARLLDWMICTVRIVYPASGKPVKTAASRSKRTTAPGVSVRALRSVIALSAATAALLLVSVSAAVARTHHDIYHPCRHEHLSVRGTAGGSLKVTNLRVSRMSCSRAAAAVRASRYEATPGGPLFTSPGFSCSGPVGPPPPGAKPRYYHCVHGRETFEFLMPGFS